MSGVWSLFSDKPLAVAIKPWFDSMSLPDISPYWITGSVGALMFLWLTYELRQSRKATNQDTNQKSTGGSLSDMDFDEQMDFVHSVVERQANRQAEKIAIQEKHDEFVSLHDACRIAYEETQSSLSALMAEKFSDGDPDNILGWYANAITESSGATLYGAKPPSKKPIEISSVISR